MVHTCTLFCLIFLNETLFKVVVCINLSFWLIQFIICFNNSKDILRVLPLKIFIPEILGLSRINVSGFDQSRVLENAVIYIYLLTLSMIVVIILYP